MAACQPVAPPIPSSGEHVLTDAYALYNGDCLDVMATLPDGAVDLSIYSPPFAGLYQYSSDARDLSNCLNREEFFEHYAFVVQAVHRLTKPGRMTAVHCTDVPTGNSGLDSLFDFPGEVIRLHEQHGWRFGQERPVTVDIIATTGEQHVRDNMIRKSQAADAMFASLVRHMNAAMHIAPTAAATARIEVPAWLHANS